MGTIPEVSEAVTPIKQSVKNINLGSNELITVDDKQKFDKLMFPYVKYPIHLQALNKLIDNDKSILPNVFRKQFITNFDDYIGDLSKYATDMNFDYKSFYELMKDLLIQKNQFLSVSNTYNMAENLGVGPDHIMSSFEKEEQLKKKQEVVNKTLIPDPVEEQQKKSELLEEYKADLNEKEFSNKQPLLINGIYEWLGEKKDLKYTVTEPLCNKKFELAKVIKQYLNIICRY